MTDGIARDLRVVGYKQISEDYLQGFTTGALRSMHSRGEMPEGSFTMGRRRVWLRSTIEKWVADLITEAGAA